MAIAPALEQLWKQKEERVTQFADVQSQIQKICGEIAGNLSLGETPAVDESDLSLKKLDEYQSQLQDLQKEKVIIYQCQRIVVTRRQIDYYSYLFLASLKL